MAARQGFAYETNVYLELLGIPSLAVTPAQVTAKFKKQGETSFTTKSLSAANWINLGSGFYTIKWDAADIDTEGTFFYTLSSVAFDNFVSDEFEVGASGAPAEPELCRVSGTLSSVGARPWPQCRVVFRPVEFPSRFGGTIIRADEIVTYPAADGTFSVDLVRNAVVVVEIERAGIRHQITIPDAPTAELLSLLPSGIINYQQ